MTKRTVSKNTRFSGSRNGKPTRNLHGPPLAAEEKRGKRESLCRDPARYPIGEEAETPGRRA